MQGISLPDSGPAPPRKDRMTPVSPGPSRPAAMASASRAPNTIPSSNEFDASRLAPCTPVQATSPTAHNPAIALAPSRSVTTPPDR